MQDAARTYSMTGGPRGSPIVGMMQAAKKDPLGLLTDNARRYGDIIPFSMFGRKVVQVNHPELVRYVLMENHKNYYKSKGYIRFESVLGQGLFTSNGDKWKRDRQRIQPMFKREQIEGYYFDVVNEVSEKYKKRWLSLTERGAAQINITREMAAITIEIVVKLLFGKGNLDEATIASIHHSYAVFMAYLKKARILPKVDLGAVFHTAAHAQFRKEIDNIEAILNSLLDQYKSGTATDKYNMLALLYAAQQQDPEHFTEQDIRDQSISMVFAGFETTSLLMQWLWYVLDAHPQVAERLRADVTAHAPDTAKEDSAGITFEQIARMDVLGAAINETMRLYPPIWMNGRAPVEDDRLGDYRIERGTVVLLPQFVMHRHPRWWDAPEEFRLERFLNGNEEKIDSGLFFPFSLGPRKCIGYRLAEMEARLVLAKLVPLFRVRALNASGNALDPGISLKLSQPLMAEITRI